MMDDNKDYDKLLVILGLVIMIAFSLITIDIFYPELWYYITTIDFIPTM